MHAAAASARATGVAAKQLGDEFHRRQALGQCVAVSAMRAEDHVVCAQVRTHAHGDGFLPDVGVASPWTKPALMAARQLLLHCRMSCMVRYHESICCLVVGIAALPLQRLGRRSRRRSWPDCRRPSG